MVFQIEYICTKKFLTFHEIRIWELYENNYNGKPTTRSYPEPTKETRRKLSESRKGKKLSEETKRKIGLVHKNKVVSEETRKKMSESHKGKASRATEVLQYSIDGNLITEYCSVKEASAKTGSDESNISKACRGKLKTSGGFIWKYK